MSDTLKPYTMITDFVTGLEIPNIGAEENRQAVAQYLVNEKGEIGVTMLHKLFNHLDPDQRMNPDKLLP